MRKICFIQFRAYPLFNKESSAVFGGAEINLYNLAVKLSEEPANTVVFYVGDYGQGHVEYYGNIAVKKIAYQNVEQYKKWRHKSFRYFFLFKELLSMDADTVITSTASELLGWICMLVKAVRRKKVIFRIGSDADTDPGNFSNQGRKFSLLYKYGIMHADAVTCQTQHQASLLKKTLGLDGIIVKNGFFIDNKGISEEEPLKKDIILWVSRTDRMKRPELFIDLAERLPDEKFVFIMPVYNYEELPILKRIAKLKNVEYIEYVPFHQIHTYYERAKLFVNTSEFEGFPNSFIQSCLARTPILSFRVNPDNIITEYGIGSCCNDDMSAAVRFVRQLTPEGVKIMGDNALRYVKINHDIEQSAREYSEIIGSLGGN